MPQSSRVTFTKSNSYSVSSLHKVKTGFHLPLQSGFTPCSPSNLYCSHMIDFIPLYLPWCIKIPKDNLYQYCFSPLLSSAYLLLILQISVEVILPQGRLHWPLVWGQFLSFLALCTSSTTFVEVEIHHYFLWLFYLNVSSSREDSVQFSSVTQSCPTICNPMDCRTWGFPAYHQLPELAQTHIHRVGDTIQPSHPLLCPSPPAFNFSQHQGLFNESVLCIMWSKNWSFSFSISP